MEPCNLDKLNLYLDGEANEQAAKGIVQHLAACSACRAALAELKLLRASLFTLPAADASSRIRARAAQAAAALCKEVRPLLSSFADRELEGGHKEAVMLHLALCQGCKSELQAYLKLKQMVTMMPEVAVPSRVREQAREALAAGRGNGFFDRRIFQLPLRPVFANVRFAQAGAFAVLALAAFTFFLNYSGSQRGDLREQAGIPVRPEQRHISGAVAPVGTNQTGSVAVKPPAGPSEKAAASGQPALVASARPRRHTASPAIVTAHRVKPASPAIAASLTSGSKIEAISIAAASPAGLMPVAVKPSARTVAITLTQLPAEIMRARAQMLQASEQYQALQAERLLDRLPKTEEISIKSEKESNPTFHEVEKNSVRELGVTLA
jgi:anti-sigma factor RsiW